MVFWAYVFHSNAMLALWVFFFLSSNPLICMKYVYKQLYFDKIYFYDTFVVIFMLPLNPFHKNTDRDLFYFIQTDLNQ